MLPPKTIDGEISLDDIQIVVLNSLQMGWTESPPFFCSATETARDIAEMLINEEKSVDPCPLKSLCVPPHKWKDENVGKNCENLINQLEVYVDDFILMSQCINIQELKCLSRRVLHAVHCIFLPPKITGHNGEEPISIKIERW